jgi:hypothetical protein
MLRLDEHDADARQQAVVVHDRIIPQEKKS